MKRLLVSLFLLTSFINNTLANELDTLYEVQNVAVIPLWYNNDEDIAKELSNTVQSSIQWMIRLIDGYNLVETENYPETQQEIINYSNKNELDLVIYGLIDIEDEYTVSLILYNSETDSIQEIEKDSVSNIMDTFDLADQLSIKIIESFIGRKLEFGRLIFNNGTIRENATTEFYINDTHIGSNLSAISPFLVGTYNLKIIQVEEDTRLEIFNEVVNISKDESTLINYSMLSFGFLDIKIKGPNVPIKVLLNGVESNIKETGIYPLPVGIYNIEPILDPFNDESLYPLESKIVEVYELENSDLTIIRNKISNGITFETDSEGEYKIEIDGEVIDSSSSGLIEAGYHDVNIYQDLGNSERRIFSRGIWLGSKIQNIEFSIPEPDENRIVLDSERSNFSLEYQGLGGSVSGVGLHFDLLGKRLGLSALVGFSISELSDQSISFNMLYMGKVYYTPWPESRISPYLGGVILIGSANESFLFLTGPLLGITVNLNNRAFSSIYVEFQSHIWLGNTFKPANQIGFGFRFF